MDFHVALPNGHRGVTVEEIAEITDAAEELGFAGVWPLDHVLVGPDLKDRYPWVLEPMVLLGYLAARTKRIRLGTSIIVLGMRNPFVVAKQAATLDLVSGGRFTLGLGAGYSEPEFRNVGASSTWSTRGKRLDEAIELFRHLWSGSTAPFHGSFYSYDEGWFAPLPVQGEKLPILVGGNSEAALNRAVRYGDIWQSTGSVPRSSSSGPTGSAPTPGKGAWKWARAPSSSATHKPSGRRYASSRKPAPSTSAPILA